jgi:cytochrome P450
MIHERQGSQHDEDNNDLLSSLLSANDDDNLSKGEVKLSDSELIGKLLFQTVAGHGDIVIQAISSYFWSRDTRYYTLSTLFPGADNSQTTAHTLSFAFALLALHPEKQEEMYQHIKRVLPDGRIPVRTSETYRQLFSQAHIVFDRLMMICHLWPTLPRQFTSESTGL